MNNNYSLKLLFLGLILISILFIKTDTKLSQLKQPDPTETYIQNISDPELKEIFRLVLIKNEKDFLTLLTMVRFRQNTNRSAIVILGYGHITVDQKPPYDPLFLLSEQNAYNMFRIMHAKMNFKAIGLEGMPPQAETMINGQSRQAVMDYMVNVSPETLNQQIITGSLFPQNNSGERADLQATFIWQFGGKIKFIPLERSDFRSSYRTYYQLRQQGVSITEIDKKLGGGIFKAREQHILELIKNFPEENIFIPVGSVHALDLCLKFIEEKPTRNIIIVFEPVSST
ncbi:MAG: hypothetical protein NTX82_06280, partial [Candidatus Parcubacteria bacterium]|nr:hypothetical protein [Candidatus Parcubacteria bacterium]